MSWASRRKSIYTLSFFLVIIIIVSIFIFSLVKKAPSCFDNIQNQKETGIDCGGPCSKLCRAEFTDPFVLWTRWSKVLSSGTYAILAYAENPNVGVGAQNVPYTFSIRDKDGILLYQGSGVTYIPADPIFVVYTDGVNIGDKIPARIEFNFGSAINWQKTENKEIGLMAVSKDLINEDTKPKLLATIKNITLNPIQNIQSVAILYDVDGNAVAFSKTMIDSIAPNSTSNIVFTWPETFTAKVFKEDIVSEILPQ